MIPKQAQNEHNFCRNTKNRYININFDFWNRNPIFIHDHLLHVILVGNVEVIASNWISQVIYMWYYVSLYDTKLFTESCQQFGKEKQREKAMKSSPYIVTKFINLLPKVQKLLLRQTLRRYEIYEIRTDHYIHRGC